MNLDDLVLSGAFFSTSRPSSPVRSPSRSRSASPDPLFPSNDDPTDSDISLPLSRSALNPEGIPTETNMQLGRTGVKGVIRDHNIAVEMEKAKRAQEIKETNRRMEKMALTARTFAEEEEERLLEKAKEEGWTESDKVGKRMFERMGRFGHLREIGESGFLDAIEGEMNETWVVLHIYDPSLTRCHDLDALLARLARQYPQTKFLRARAGAVGFASTPLTRPSTAAAFESNGGLGTISEEELYCDGEDPQLYPGEEEEEEIEVVTDTDLLPTLLIYRGGQIVHTWIRADWEAEAWVKKGGRSSGTSIHGIEALLRGHNIILPATNGNCGFSSDEDEDTHLVSSQVGGEDDDIFDL